MVGLNVLRDKSFQRGFARGRRGTFKMYLSGIRAALLEDESLGVIILKSDLFHVVSIYGILLMSAHFHKGLAILSHF